MPNPSPSLLDCTRRNLLSFQARRWSLRERDLAAEVAFTLKAIAKVPEGDSGVRAIVEHLRRAAARSDGKAPAVPPGRSGVEGW